MLQTKIVEKFKTHFMFSNVFQKIVLLWDNVEECGAARQATDENIIWCSKGAICMPNN